MVDLKGWVIAIASGTTLIGQPVKGDVRYVGREVLSPVYELKCSLVQGREGTGIVHAAFPVCLLGSVRAVDVPAGAIVIPVDELSKTERRSLAAGVQNAEGMVAAMRAAESGVVLAGADTKLPPVKLP